MLHPAASPAPQHCSRGEGGEEREWRVNGVVSKLLRNYGKSRRMYATRLRITHAVALVREMHHKSSMKRSWRGVYGSFFPTLIPRSEKMMNFAFVCFSAEMSAVKSPVAVAPPGVCMPMHIPRRSSVVLKSESVPFVDKSYFSRFVVSALAAIRLRIAQAG